MKSYPSNNILNDPLQRNIIEQMLTDIKMDLKNYMIILKASIIKEKQILTTLGKQTLLLPEHNFLYEHLLQRYPERNFDSMYLAYIYT